MNDIFILFIENSLWLSVVILAAVLFFKVSKGKFSAKLPCIVWLIIAAKLIIPWNIPLPKYGHSVEIPSVSQVYIPPITQMPVSGEISPEHYPSQGYEAESYVQTEDITMYVWLGGILAVIFLSVLRNVSFKRELNLYSSPASDELKEELAKISMALDMRTPDLYICDRISSPMAVGLLLPKIYLPKGDYGDKVKMIFRHELTHIKRRDLWKKLIFQTAKALHWFNPLVYLMVSEADRALEVACDADVVKDADMEYRKSYSLIILDQAREDRAPKYLTTCFACGKNTLKARFSEILSLSPKKSGRTVSVLVLALCLACGVFVSCKPNDTSPDYETYEEMANVWAQCFADRNGKNRYDMMNADMKAEFEKAQMYEGKLIYSIGWSSPWVTDFTVETEGDTATIHYTLQDSTQTDYYMDETLKFGDEYGKKVVIGYVVSPLQAEPIGERQQLWEMTRGSSGLDDNVALRDFIENYTFNTVYYSFTDKYFVDSAYIAFDEVNITDNAVEAKFSLDLSLHNYDAEVNRLESGVIPERMPIDNDFEGSHHDVKYFGESITVTYNLVFTCDADYNTDTFKLTYTDGSIFIRSVPFNSAGETTMFGNIEISGNNVILSRKQFNTENNGLTPNGFYITDWGVKENLTLTDKTTIKAFNENFDLEDTALKELVGDYRYFWVTVNENNEVLQISEQYIP